MTALDDNYPGAAHIIEVAKEAARLVGAARPVDFDEADLYLVATPEGKVEALDLEEYLATPRRRKAEVTLHEADSLVRYVVAQGVTPQARLYGDQQGGRVVAILDDHSVAEPGWREHRATLALRESVAWKLWHGKNKQTFDQVSFAHHVEEGGPEIIDPDGATMLELVMTFEQATKVEFKSGVRLSSGQRQLTYIESEAGAEKRMTLPERFTLRLQVYEEGTAYEVECRLRYRIEGGALKLTYLMNRPEDVARTAFLAEVRKVEAGTKAQAVIGIP